LAEASKTYKDFKILMTIKHDHRMKNHLASETAGYSANQTTFVTNLIHQELQKFVNQMHFFQQEPTKDENQNPNPQIAPDKANATITNDTIKDLFKSLLKEHKTNHPPKLNPRHKERTTRTSPTAIPMASHPSFGTTAQHAATKKKATKMPPHSTTS
jgi:hypothetical protein